jgi:hypothetical protein
MGNVTVALTRATDDPPEVRYDFEALAPAYDIELKDGRRWRLGSSGPGWIVYDPSPLPTEDDYFKCERGLQDRFHREAEEILWELYALNSRRTFSPGDVCDAPMTPRDIVELFMDWVEEVISYIEVTPGVSAS